MSSHSDGIEDSAAGQPAGLTIYPFPLVADAKTIDSTKRERKAIERAAFAEVGVEPRRIVVSGKRTFRIPATAATVMRAQELGFRAVGLDYDLLTLDEYRERVIETWPDWFEDRPSVFHKSRWWAESGHGPSDPETEVSR